MPVTSLGCAEMEKTLSGKKIGFAMTGSFCTFAKIFPELKRLVDAGAEITPIYSDSVMHINCRFGSTEDFVKTCKTITGKEPLITLEQVEPIGPKGLLDLLVIAPCTGNTLSKLSLAITDSAVLMAAKAHLRNDRPVLIFPSTNDALGINFKNIGALYNSKNIYFVPFRQDAYEKKPSSMVGDSGLIFPAVAAALHETQLQPVILEPHR